jgi:hypothetical protein
MVLMALKGHEFVNRSDDLRIARPDAQLRSPREIARLVGDGASFVRHHLRPWYGLRVHKAWYREVSRPERAGDRPDVGANFADANGIVDVPNELNAPPIGERIELMGRCVLVDAHRLLPAFLQSCEGAILRGG